MSSRRIMPEPAAGRPDRAALLAHVRALSMERHPRSAPAALKKAEAYLAEQFRLAGLDVSAHPFQALGGTYRNIIGTRTPHLSPPLIVAAHYDTVEGSPGADDNASALAVMLEAARCLRGAALTRCVRFIGFCLEEEDLLGSLAYAAHLRAGNEDVHGAVVLECVGYARTEHASQRYPSGLPVSFPPVGDFLGIVGNAASKTLAGVVEDAARKHAPALKTVTLVVPGNGERIPDTRRSDHAAFWHYGFQAVMLTDTANFRNPHYHRPTDTPDTLDLGFMEQVAAAVIAAVMTLAGAGTGNSLQ